jgi:hypothetical protein
MAATTDRCGEAGIGQDLPKHQACSSKRLELQMWPRG